MQNVQSMSMHDVVSGRPAFPAGPRAGAIGESQDGGYKMPSSVMRGTGFSSFLAEGDVDNSLLQLSQSVGLLQESLKTNNSILRDVSEMMADIRNGRQTNSLQQESAPTQMLQEMMKRQKEDICSEIRSLLLNVPASAPQQDIVTPRYLKDLEGVVPLLQQQLMELEQVKSSVSALESKRDVLDGERKRQLLVTDDFDRRETNSVHVEPPFSQTMTQDSRWGKAGPLGMDTWKKKFRQHIDMQKYMHQRVQWIQHIEESCGAAFGRFGVLCWKKVSSAASHLPKHKEGRHAEDFFLKTIRVIVQSNIFGILTLILIVCNSFWIGWSTDRQLQRWRDDPNGKVDEDWFPHVDLAFAIVFSVEIALRILAFRSRFFSGPGWKFNLFDLFVVTISLISNLADNANLSALRLVRVLRIFRMLRVFRVFPVFKEMRHMVCVIVDSSRLVIWSLLLLGFANYLGAVAILDGILSDSRLNANSIAVIQKFYSSLPSCMLTLFYIITGGITWGELDKQMQDLSFLVRAFLQFYVMMTFFCFLPVIVGMFTSRVFDAQRFDTCTNMHHRNTEGQIFLREMVEACYAAGYKKDEEQLDEDDLTRLLLHSDVAWFLDVHGVEMSAAEALSLFDLDTEKASSISLHDFVYGCQWVKLQQSQGKQSDQVLLADNMSAMGIQIQHVNETLKQMGARVTKIKDLVEQNKRLPVTK